LGLAPIWVEGWGLQSLEGYGSKAPNSFLAQFAPQPALKNQQLDMIFVFVAQPPGLQKKSPCQLCAEIRNWCQAVLGEFPLSWPPSKVAVSELEVSPIEVPISPPTAHARIKARHAGPQTEAQISAHWMINRHNITWGGCPQACNHNGRFLYPPSPLPSGLVAGGQWPVLGAGQTTAPSLWMRCPRPQEKPWPRSS